MSPGPLGPLVNMALVITGIIALHNRDELHVKLVESQGE